MKNDQNEAAQIIDLDQAKKNALSARENDSLSRYLSALSFSQLIDETSILIQDLNRDGSTEEIILKSKMVLKELGLRIKNSHGLSESFLKMKAELEAKLSPSQ